MLSFHTDHFYQGKRISGLRHGLGIQTYLTNAKTDIIRYDGYFVDNSRTGLGQAIYKDGGFYKGDWKDDKRDGQGKFISHQRHQFDGTWKDDNIINGSIDYVDGCQYIGEISNYRRHGLGKYQYILRVSNQVDDDINLMKQQHQAREHNYIYNGSWKDNKREGFGHCVYNDLHEYLGIWKDDKPDGLGTFQNERDIIYTGNWKDGYMHGQGTFKLLNGKIYQGEFKNGFKDGSGIVLNDKGIELYRGTWKDDKLISDISQVRSINIDNKGKRKATQVKSKRIKRLKSLESV